MLDPLKTSQTMNQLRDLLPTDASLRGFDLVRTSEVPLMPTKKILRGLILAGVPPEDVVRLSKHIFVLRKSINTLGPENDAYEIFLQQHQPELLNDASLGRGTRDMKTDITTFITEHFGGVTHGKVRRPKTPPEGLEFEDEPEVDINDENPEPGASSESDPSTESSNDSDRTRSSQQPESSDSDLDETEDSEVELKTTQLDQQSETQASGSSSELSGESTETTDSEVSTDGTHEPAHGSQEPTDGSQEQITVAPEPAADDSAETAPVAPKLTDPPSKTATIASAQAHHPPNIHSEPDTYSGPESSDSYPPPDVLASDYKPDDTAPEPGVGTCAAESVSPESVGYKPMTEGSIGDDRPVKGKPIKKTSARLPIRLRRDVISQVHEALTRAADEAFIFWHNEVQNALVVKRHDEEYINRIKTVRAQVDAIPVQGLVAMEVLPRKLVSVIRGSLSQSYRSDCDLTRKISTAKRQVARMTQKVKDHAILIDTLYTGDLLQEQGKVEMMAKLLESVERTQKLVIKESARHGEKAFLASMKLEGVQAEKKTVQRKIQKSLTMVDKLKEKIVMTKAETNKKQEIKDLRSKQEGGVSRIVVPSMDEYYSLRVPYLQEIKNLKANKRKEFIANLRLGNCDSKYFNYKYWALMKDGYVFRV